MFVFKSFKDFSGFKVFGGVEDFQRFWSFLAESRFSVIWSFWRCKFLVILEFFFGGVKVFRDFGVFFGGVKFFSDFGVFSKFQSFLIQLGSNVRASSAVTPRPSVSTLRGEGGANRLRHFGDRVVESRSPSSWFRQENRRKYKGFWLIFNMI